MPISFDANKGIGNPNTTQIPDQFLDWIAPFLSGTEVKVMLYIFRRTFGFKKDQDAIAYSQFLRGIVKKDGQRLDNGAGVSEGSLIKALENLTTIGLIFRHHQYASDGGRDTTLYEVNRDGQPHFLTKASRPPTAKNVVAPYRKNYGRATPNKDDTPTSKIRVTKDSIKQHTVIQHTGTQADNVCVPVNKPKDEQEQVIEETLTNSNLIANQSDIGSRLPEKVVQVTDEVAVTTPIENAIIALNISPKKANDLLVIARQNKRSDEYIAAWIEKARSKNNPPAYFITLVKDNAELTDTQRSYKTAHPALDLQSELDENKLEKWLEPYQEETQEQSPPAPEVDPRVIYAIRKSYQEITQNKYAVARAINFENGKVTVKVMGNYKPNPKHWLLFAQKHDPTIESIEIR